MQVQNGQVIAFFAFDVGYEISLDQVSKLLASSPAQPLLRNKPTPNYLQYTRPPQVLQLGEFKLHDVPGQVQATLFDFGAVSIAFRWNINDTDLVITVEDLPELSQFLYRLDLENQARQQLDNLIKKIRPAITRHSVSPLVEDYYVFILENLENPLFAETLVDEFGPCLAQALRFDTQPLSRMQQNEALSEQISYYQNDLVVIDWNAAIIYDRDFSDTANVLELVNVELLEARFIDSQLNKRIRDYEGLQEKRRSYPVPLRRPYQRIIQELADLRIDYTLLAERVDNALKLIGDPYLARIHSAAARRFHLQEWEGNVARKLDIIGDLYQLLVDRVETAQGQTLELVVIILILIEIVLGIFQLK